MSFGEGKAFDDRGSLTFYNDFHPTNQEIARIYIVENFQSRTVRAWHGHKLEFKWVTCISGAALICYMPISNWDEPLVPQELRKRVVITAEQPKIIPLPSGGINGSMSLLPNTKLMYFSNAALYSSEVDDYRYPWDFFGKEIWEVINR